MLTIYGSDLSGPAIKVRLVASYMNIPHEWRVMNLREGEQKQEWFLKINPIGKVPAIDDDGFHLFESNAIAKYLADKHNSPLYPKEAKARAVIDQWIDYISFHLGVNVATITYNRVFAPRMGRPTSEPAINAAQGFLDANFPALEKQMAGHAFVINDTLTLADIVLLAALEPVDIAQIALANYPNIAAWRKKIKQMPFYTQCYKDYGEMLKK